MAKGKGADTRLQEAYEFQDYLLWMLMGENMGKKPKHPLPDGIATFPEKKAFLDTMFKGAEQGRKSKEEVVQPGFLEIMRKQQNGDRADKRRRDSWGREGGADAIDSSEGNSDSTNEGI